MDIESSQLSEVAIQAQGHEEACILIGQLSMFGLVVNNPCRVNLGGRGYLEASSNTIMEASPAGHVRGHIDVATVEVHCCVPRRGPT